MTTVMILTPIPHFAQRPAARPGEALIAASQPEPLRNFTRQNLPSPRGIGSPMTVDADPPQ
jgi:hypothetical protein